METAAQIEINRKIKELTELERVVTNGLNWLAEVDVKIAYIHPVSQFVNFLQGFLANVQQQRKAIESVAPAPVDEASNTPALTEAK